MLGLCTIAVANSGNQSKTASTTPTVAATRTAAPGPTRTPAVANPAGTCAPQPCANDNYGWIVTVSDVKYDVRPGSEFDKPEQGNVFVTMNVVFTNKKDQEQHANPTAFVLLDGAGVKHTWKPMISASCQTWDPVNVTSGAIFGPKCLSFEAAGGKPAGLVLLWTPSLGDYRIKLT
jgi:hypothetical protein